MNSSVIISEQIPSFIIQNMFLLKHLQSQMPKVPSSQQNHELFIKLSFAHGLRTPKEEIAFTARPKIKSQSIFMYGHFFCQICPNFQISFICHFIGYPQFLRNKVFNQTYLFNSILDVCHKRDKNSWCNKMLLAPVNKSRASHHFPIYFH